MRKDESEITVDNPRCDHVTESRFKGVLLLREGRKGEERGGKRRGGREREGRGGRGGEGRLTC